MCYLITDGPSKFDLMVSLMHGHSDRRQMVQFDLKPDEPVQAGVVKVIGVKMEFSINRIEREDGSGEKWNLHLYREGRTRKAFYNTQSRKGWLEY